MITQSDFDDNQPTDEDGDGSQPHTMPLGVEDSSNGFDDSGFDLSQSPVKKHANGAILLAIVVVIALGGLYSMRTLTKASASATAAPAEIEQTIDSFLRMLRGNSGSSDRPALASTDDSVLDVLSESYTERQVPLQNVQRNPFIIFEESVVEPTPTQTRSTPVDPRIEQRRVRTGQINQASSRMQLRSVLMGRDPLANINSSIVRVGETLTIQPENVTFVVQWIDSDSVGLLAQDADLDLAIEVTIELQRNR